MQDTLKKGIDAIKRAGSAVNGELNKVGFGYEHLAKKNGMGGTEHINEFKFGKLGKVDIPGKMEYTRSEDPRKDMLKKVEPMPAQKPMQMEAIKKRVYSTPKGPVSNGKGVGY